MKNFMTKIEKSDFITVYFFDMVSKCFTIITTILIIRCLSKNDYAEYTVFNSIGSFIAGVLGSGIGLAYTRYAVQLRQREYGEDNKLYLVLRKIMLFGSGVLILGCFFMLLVLEKKMFNIFAGVLYGVLLANYQLNTIFFQSKEQYTTGGIISNIKNIVVALSIFIIFILPGEMKVSNLLLVYLSIILYSWIITNIYINKKFFIDKKSKKISYEEYNVLRLMLKESVWIILYMFMLSAFNQIDVLILNNECEPLDVALYGVAFKYYSLILSLLPSLQVILRVKNSSMEMLGNARKRRKSVINWIKKSVPLSIALFITGFILAKMFFPILNGKDYSESINIFNILLIGACLSYITAPNVSVMLAAGKQKLLFFLSVGAFLINLLGNYIYIPMFGGIAAAITTVVAHFFLNGGSTIILLRSKE